MVEANNIWPYYELRKTHSSHLSLKILEYNLVPLLMSVVIIGNDLSVSALTRALGANIKRTSINELSFGLLDYITFLFTFICFVGFILSKLGM